MDLRGEGDFCVLEFIRKEGYHLSKWSMRSFYEAIYVIKGEKLVLIISISILKSIISRFDHRFLWW